MTALAFILAATLEFHGVIGQSANADEEPLGFTGVQSMAELHGGRVVFIGDDNVLYEIRNGRPVSTGKKAHGRRLDFDGVTLRSLDRYLGVWEIDTATFESRRTISPKNIRWDIAGVRPATEGHPFAALCKFVTWDENNDKMIAFGDDGREIGELFPMPKREGNCRIECFGFLQGSGDLAMVTYWPDLKIHRFRPDGSRVKGDGWPVRRGHGRFQAADGRLWHFGLGSAVPLCDNMTGVRPVRVGAESELTGYARQGEVEFVGASQGLFVRKRGEKSFRRRMGGIGRLTALAVNGPYVFFSMGGKMRWIYLDGDGYEPFASSDALILRIDNGRNYTDAIIDIAPDGPDALKVAAGNAGLWRFTPSPKFGHVNINRLWSRISKERTEKVSSCTTSTELMEELGTMSVPGGFKPGKFSAQGSWLVVEDVRNHRLLRFKLVREDAENSK